MRLFLFISVTFFALPCLAEQYGADYQPCGEISTTIDIVQCIENKTNVWDQRLNNAYKSLKQHVDFGQRDPLLAAQRLWIKYRDANCGFYGSQEGSIRQIAAAECLRSMTQDRTLELEQAARP